MKFLNLFKILFLLAIILVNPLDLSAQADPCDDPLFPPCPIDSNLVVLLVAAGIIGAKKTFFKKYSAKV